MMRRSIGRLVGTVGCMLLVTAALTVPAGAVDSPSLDVDVARELAATKGQGEFSDFLGVALEEFPDGVVDFSWQADHGLIMVTPQIAVEVEKLAASHPADVVVSESDPGAVPYLDRSTVELAVLDAAAQVDAAAVAARYEPTTGGVVLTVWGDSSSGAPYEIRRAAEKDPEFPTVVIEYEDPSDPPRENASH